MRKFYLTVLSLMAAGAALAMPAKPGLLLTVPQPDGSLLSFYQRGDESIIDNVTADGYRIALDQNGAYRYAEVNADGIVVPMKDAPVAHDAKKRTQAERRFVQTLTPADMQQVAVRSLSPLARTMQAPSRADEGAGLPDMKKGSFPVKGHQPCLVLLVEFSNNWEFTFSNEEISAMLNQEGYSDNNFTGSARDYFVDNSMGQFTPQFDVVGPVKLSKPYFYYGKDAMGYRDQRAGDMVAEACQLAHDELGVNFADYDMDNDGMVDMVYVIYVKYGQNLSGDTNQIWPHKGYLRGTWGINKVLDGKGLDVYACSGELYGGSGYQSAGIGAICHEFSHVLGLTDHYNQENPYAYETGTHDIMCSGPYNNMCLTPPNYSAMERMSLGWLEPEMLDRPMEGITLENLATSNKAWAIPTESPNDFFLLETREQTGWDAYLKDNGLMISRVSYVKGDWENNNPNRVAHKGYTIMCADNLPSEGSENADFWPNGTANSFTSASQPAMTLADGTVLEGKGVYDIQRLADGEMARFTFGQGLYCPHSLRAVVEDGKVKLTWTGSSDAIEYQAYCSGTTSNFQESATVKQCEAEFNAPEGDVFRFWVKAVSHQGVSEPSHEILLDLANIAITDLSQDSTSAPATYFDLMGRQVTNPQGGIYVKVQGGKAVKVKM